MIPKTALIFFYHLKILQDCQICGFRPTFSISIFFRNLDFFYFFLSENEKNISGSQKIDRNRTSGFGDIVLQSQEIIEILRLFSKKNLNFLINLNLGLEKLIIMI